MSAKKQKIPATVRNAVWLKYIGDKSESKCYCCKLETITRGSFQCGHIVAEKNGGKVTLENLRPICGLCNTSMGTRDMNEFIHEYGFDAQEKKEEKKESLLSKIFGRKLI